MVIVGGGITAALVAHELVHRGKKVIIVDKRVPATGSTSASTALLLFETDTPLGKLAKLHGRTAALHVYRRGRSAIRELRGIVHGLGLDCGWKDRKSLYLASDADGLRELRREFRLRRSGAIPGTWLTGTDLRRRFGLQRPGAIYSPGCAEMDAMAFTRQLLAHDCATGRLRIFARTKVRSVRATEEGVTVRTARSARITADYAVLATGYEAAPFLDDARVLIHSSYVIASQPLERRATWHDDCLIWETARPYLYLRNTPDGRILVGGEDEALADPRRRDRLLPTKARRLVRRFQQLFPHIPFNCDFAWCGTFVESPDGLPLIGPRGDDGRIFYALGYGGNGITFSQMAAKILGQLCTGGRHQDAKLFRFDRPSVSRKGRSQKEH